jgi:hypothetical protein
MVVNAMIDHISVSIDDSHQLRAPFIFIFIDHFNLILLFVFIFHGMEQLAYGKTI